MAEPLLAVAGLNGFYGAAQVLFEVSLEIREGETLALIGANGAGKSTLLRTVIGLRPSPREAVRLDGRPVGGLPANELVSLGVALVPEGRRLFPTLTVEENLLIGGQLGRPGRWTLDAVYALFPALKAKRRVPGPLLSGGQQQMVAIGRALMSNPRLLLLDEVSLGLAPVVIEDIYAALPDVIAHGTATVLVEQDVGRALRIADRFLCLREGRIVLEGLTGDAVRAEITEAYFGAHA